MFNLNGKKTVIGGCVMVLAVAASRLAEAYPAVAWLPAVAEALTYGGTLLAGVGAFHKGLKAKGGGNA